MEDTAGIVHFGGFDASTRKIPTLAFLEKYTAKVDSLQLTGPFHDWYGQSCQFYDTTATVYDGGDAIWSWMQKLFGGFAGLRHDIKVIRICTRCYLRPLLCATLTYQRNLTFT
jgi:hypothetical protein